MIADRYWLDVRSKFQGLWKESLQSVFQLHHKSSELLLLTLLFQEVFNLDQISLAVL